MSLLSALQRHHPQAATGLGSEQEAAVSGRNRVPRHSGRLNVANGCRHELSTGQQVEADDEPTSTHDLRFDQGGPDGLPSDTQASSNRTHRDPASEQANHLCSLVHVQPRHTARCVPTAQMSEHRRAVDAVLLRELLDGCAREIVPDETVDLGRRQKCLYRLDSPHQRPPRVTHGRLRPTVLTPVDPTIPAVDQGSRPLGNVAEGATEGPHPKPLGFRGFRGLLRVLSDARTPGAAAARR